MVAPQVPTGRTVGQTIFNHHPHCEVDHPVGVMRAGRGNIRQIDVEMLFASATVVRRVGHQQINGASGRQITQVV
jgi:hypothetical protein